MRYSKEVMDWAIKNDKGDALSSCTAINPNCKNLLRCKRCPFNWLTPSKYADYKKQLSEQLSVKEVINQILDIMEANGLDLGIEDCSDGIFVTISNYEKEEQACIAVFPKDCCESISVADMRANLEKNKVRKFTGEVVE